MIKAGYNTCLSLPSWTPAFQSSPIVSWTPTKLWTPLISGRRLYTLWSSQHWNRHQNSADAWEMQALQWKHSQEPIRGKKWETTYVQPTKAKTLVSVLACKTTCLLMLLNQNRLLHNCTFIPCIVNDVQWTWNKLNLPTATVLNLSRTPWSLKKTNQANTS